MLFKYFYAIFYSTFLGISKLFYNSFSVLFLILNKCFFDVIFVWIFVVFASLLLVGIVEVLLCLSVDLILFWMLNSAVLNALAYGFISIFLYTSKMPHNSLYEGTYWSHKYLYFLLVTSSLLKRNIQFILACI